MRTRIRTYVGIGVGVVMFLAGLVLWSIWMADSQTAKWQETCVALDAELIDTPKYYGCIRDGEVVYP